MRPRSDGSTTDAQRKPRRGREKQAKRWGQINKVELDALLVDLMEDGVEADDESRQVALRYEAISRVSWVLLAGGRLSTDSYAAGVISQAAEPLRFACSRKSDGRVIEMFQAYDEGNIDERGPYAITLRERDWSAFAAARAFVDHVGASRALEAIADPKRAQKAVPKARSSVVAIAP